MARTLQAPAGQPTFQTVTVSAWQPPVVEIISTSFIQPT